ncbi:MAG: Stk1 family PASTA domain-containing Ser/Thr kinase, partial [Actinomycetota bacterium]|nr:Stk1 family PASTA domain-containing Ser/Thr kinase [Actinomycetota bacterium]
MAQQVFTDRYQIVRHLARGGMAEVYLARDLLLDRPVALKVLFPEFAHDRSFVERFRREARAAANLNHPNIVSIYDWGEESGTYFIVMEYVDGRTLRDVIRSEGPLLSQRAAEIGADIGAALAFAHANGLIHRDVKPGNVLISGHVKVTDFGIARAADPQESLTQTGAVMGTATYFSPEQAQGMPLDGRSDVYSLGVVLYEMVAARPPFVGDTPVAIAYQHVREEPVPPSHHNHDVPHEFEAIILKAMSKDRSERYQSAQELRADLLRYSKGQPPEAATTAAIAAVAAAAPTSAMATTMQDPVDGTRIMSRQTAVLEEEPPKPKRSSAYFVVLGVLLALLALLLFLLATQLGIGGTTEVTVPTVVGQQQAEAERVLSDAGLEAEVEPQQSDLAVGQVLSQDPQGAARAKKGSTVTLKVSSGPAPANVPDVRGRDVDAARDALDAAGFEVRTTTRADEQVRADIVIDQDPGPGPAPKGSTVTLIVSSGREQARIPDVSGQEQADAANVLGQAGFSTAVQTQNSDTVERGQVIRTQPAAGTPLAKGSTVTMIVSAGP